MKSLRIVTDKKSLQQISTDVDMSRQQDVQQLVKSMKRFLESTPNGVGLSAIQIGRPLRLFIVNVGEDCSKIIPFINPVITEFSEETESGVEGCLSFPKAFGYVTRSKSITIEYADLHNKRRCQTLEGFIARVVQHEYDHINGICCVDKMDIIEEDQ